MMRLLGWVFGAALLVTALRLLPFLPGPYLSVAIPLSSLVQAVAYVSVLVAPLADVWLVYDQTRIMRSPVRRGPAAFAIIAAMHVAPFCEFAIVPDVEEASRNRAIDNCVPLLRDIERYRIAHGRYPESMLSVWGDYSPGVIGVERYRYEPSGEAYNVVFEQLSHVAGTREFVVYNPRGEQQMTSHDSDLLHHAGTGLELRRGHYAVREASRPGWKRFLFD